MTVRRATPEEDARVGALVVTEDDGRRWVVRFEHDAWSVRLLDEQEEET